MKSIMQTLSLRNRLSRLGSPNFDNCNDFDAEIAGRFVDAVVASLSEYSTQSEQAPTAFEMRSRLGIQYFQRRLEHLS